MICQSHHNAKLYQLPDALQCKGNEYENWSVTIYKRNIAEYYSPAKSLKIIERECKAKVSFWGVKTQDKESTTIQIKEGEARKLIQQHSCIDKEGNTRLNELVKGFDCEYNWPKTTTKITWSCYYHEGQVIAKHDGFFGSTIASMKGCNYKQGYCSTSDGKHLTWEVIRQVDDSFVEVGSFNATKVGNNLLVPKLAMTFHKPENSKNEWIDREFKIVGQKIEVVRTTSQIKQEVGNLTTEGNSNEEAIKALRSEIMSKIAYVLDIIQSPSAKVEYMCDLYNMVYDIERVQARSNPTWYIRQKLNNTLLVATAMGNYVMAHPCYEIKDYEFVTEVGKCYNGIKIQYKLPGKDIQYIGYVNPQTNMISSNYHVVNCNNKGSTLSFINNMVRLHYHNGEEPKILNTTTAINLGHMPLAGVPLPKDYINTDWISNPDELAHTDMSTQIVD